MSKLFGDVHDSPLRRSGSWCSQAHPHRPCCGDGVSALADDLGVEGAVDDNGLADLVQSLRLLQEIAAALLELLLHRLVDADPAQMTDCSEAQIMPLSKVLEWMMELTASIDIGGVVDDGRGVAGAHAQGRFAGGVSSLHHAGAAGGQDDVSLLHQRCWSAPGSECRSSR